jgi:hypothetical protein
MKFRLTQIELENLYYNCLNGIISKKELSESNILQLKKYTLDKIDKKRIQILELINTGNISFPMIKNNVEVYLSSQIEQEKNILKWLSEMDIEEIYNAEKLKSAILFEECMQEAEKIQNIDDEIKFWYLKKSQYLNQINYQTFNVSAIITTNNHIEVFFDKIVTDKIKQLREIQAAQNEIEIKFKTNINDESIIPKFENNFDKIKPAEIYKHFKAGLVEKGYLTEVELNEYLKAAFELKKIPETRFKIKDAPNKAAVEAVFYKYYKNIAGKIHGKQNQYAALLGNYFEGYKTSTVSSNFSKSVY